MAQTLHLDARLRRLRLGDGSSAPLSRIEASLLDALLSRPGRVLSRGELAVMLALSLHRHHLNIIDLTVSRLRWKLLRAGADAQRIETVRGAGYRLKPTDEDPSCDTSVSSA